MDIYALIKEDYTKINILFEKIMHARGDERRRFLFELARSELMLHAHAKEAAFFTQLDTVPDDTLRALLRQARDGQDELEMYLTRLVPGKATPDRWLITFGMLYHTFLRLCEFEQCAVFIAARPCFNQDEARRMAERMQAIKMEETQEAA